VPIYFLNLDGHMLRVFMAFGQRFQGLRQVDAILLKVILLVRVKPADFIMTRLIRGPVAFTQLSES